MLRFTSVLLISLISFNALSIDLKRDRITGIIRTLASVHAFEQKHALQAYKDLEGLEAVPAAAGPDIIKLFGSNNQKCAKIAPELLKILKPMGKKEVKPLIALLKIKNDTIRLQTIIALGNLGKAARKAKSKLSRFKRNKNEALKSATILAIKKIRGKA